MKNDAQSLHDHIRLEAFLLSEKAGHPTGMDEAFWAQAEAIVQGRAAVVVAPGKPVKPKAKAEKPAKETAAKKTVTAKSPAAPKAEKPAAPKMKPGNKRAK